MFLQLRSMYLSYFSPLYGSKYLVVLAVILSMDHHTVIDGINTSPSVVKFVITL